VMAGAVAGAVWEAWLFHLSVAKCLRFCHGEGFRVALLPGFW